MRWHVDVIGEFYECEESSVAYYSPDNGDTHLLSEFAAYIIRQLSSEPITIDQLVERISPVVDPQELTDIARQLPQLLDQLLTIEIVAQS